MKNVESYPTPRSFTSRKDEAIFLLAESSNLLAYSSDYEATLETIANLLVTSLAMWCSIDLVGLNSKIERVAVVHRDPAMSDMAKKILLKYPASPTATRGVYKVIQTGKSILIPHTPESSWARRADDPEHLQMLMALGSTTYMCVPLIARGKVVGSIMLLSSERTYDEIDLKTAEDLSRFIALAVDNVHMFRKMQEAVVIRDEFLAILSHELRTPLNVIQGWIDILKMKKLSEEKLQGALDILDRNCRMQTRMINDLLDISRITKGKLYIERDELDLRKVIRSAIESVLLSAQNKNISLDVSISDFPQIVKGDFSHLQRVFVNLLTNAIKFTPSSGGVKLETQNTEREVIIKVQDTGVGINSEFIPYVFESFRQENSSTTRNYAGLGLGLAIAKHIVDQHQGNITASSRGKNQGAEFTVSLPLCEEAIAQDLAINFSDNSLAVKSLKGVNILIVDDTEDMLTLLKHSLQKSGASIITANCAKKAFESLREKKPDILISDIGMPIEDGYSLIKRVRQLPAEQGGETTAIALTAYAREEERLKSIAAGFDFHFSKPIEAHSLISNVSKIFHNQVARHS